MVENVVSPGTVSRPVIAWWRHQNGNIFALLALWAGNSPVPVNSPHKGQWRGALMFSLIYAWLNDWVNNREAGDLRRHRGHYDVNVMTKPCGRWSNALLLVLTSVVMSVEEIPSNHLPTNICSNQHDDVIKWKQFPRYCPFVRGTHRWPVYSPHKDQWHGALIFSLIWAWINGWVRDASDLRRHGAYYDVIVMEQTLSQSSCIVQTDCASRDYQ